MYKTKKNFSLIFLLFILLIIFAHGCGINDLLDNKKNKQTDNNSFEIGPNGGTISIDGISISIPAGAFEQTANIKVTQSNNITEEDIVTPIYSVEGFPDNYSLPIDITIKLNDTTSNETYLVVQEKSFIPSLNSTAPSNVFFDAIIRGDSIEGQIPALTVGITKTSNSITKTLSTGDDSFVIFGVANLVNYTTTSNHFKITFDEIKDDPINIVLLGQYLEVAYTKIMEMGFDLNRRTWPVSVFITELPKAHGLFTASKWSINNGYIRFDRHALGDESKLKPTAIHEFFHLVQYLYDPRNSFRQGRTQPNHFWFNEACSVWSEELTANTEYVSDNWIANQTTPFSGLQAGALDNPEKHGYGMSAFVKYLIGKYGKNILVSIYKKINSGRHVIDAINNSINYNLFLDCNSFFKEYTQGKIVSNFGLGNLFKIIEDEFDIKSASDTLKAFTANYKDLSAKVYLVKLQNPNFQTDETLEISIDQNLCNISVFKYPSPGDLSLVAEGKKNCVISGIKDLYQQHKQLYVMVTNSNFISNNYQPSNLDINLTMKVKTTKKLSVEVSINIDGAVYKEKVNNENWTTKQNETFLFNPSAGVNGPKVGTFNNNVFLSPLDDVYNPLHVESSYIKITFLENPKRINLECELIIDDKTAGIKKHRKFSIAGIPEEDTGRYWEYGGDLSRASIIDTYERHDYSGDLISELVSINPGSNAKVEVKIK